MTIDINKNSALIDSAASGYSGCGCGNRRYYTKAEIDEMLKDVIDPEQIKQILDEMFDEYIEGGELEQLIINAIAGLYTNEEIDDMLEELEARMKTWSGEQGYLKDITLTINGTPLHNNDSIVIEGGDVSNKLDVTAFTQAMENETARTESTYAKKSEIPSLQGYATQDWVVNQDYLKDITLTINGTPVHNNGDIIIEGGGGEPVDISGKLDTSVFTAYTSSTETWENKMEDCCDEVKTYMDYLKYLIDGLQSQIDELKPEPDPTPTPTGDTLTLTAVYDVTSTTEETVIVNINRNFGDINTNTAIYKFTYNGVDYNTRLLGKIKFTFPETGEQTVQLHFRRTDIPDWCFYRTPLKRITISNGITKIGESAFEFTLLSSIIIPNSVTEIGERALRFVYDTTEARNCNINIGTGLTTIGVTNWPRAKGIMTYTLNATVPPTIKGSGYVFSVQDVAETIIYVPSGSVNAYKTTNITNNPNVIQAKP